ncbi:hypothetical protein [Mucilaginibacter gilvus]|uniref:Uncharacterized protein n=1 Tax=Mucilaginibacter gilvus TaxID=2305909 RepID=A0A444MNE1_9SPHI|nr:hypothetical protein [Mucilaginibacter gilvus]RWY51190.1 hypothetical protein EPL05_14085 [Mucilaginibacter gilvus]
MQLYINNQLADLADDSPVALTFQINNLAEVKNQQGNTSNQFKLPLTQRNRQILGFPDDVAFTTGQPYDNYEAKIIQDGLEIVPNGIAFLNGIEGDGASMTVLSGNVDFFDTLDAKIYDMGDSSTIIGKQNLLNAYGHKWDVDTVVRSQQNTEGYIWPVVDYGTITYPSTTTTDMVDIRQMRPGFFLKTMVELMARQAGYRINPNSFLLKQPLYDKLIVQFANDDFSHGVDYQNTDDNLGITVQNGLTYVHSNSVYEEEVRFSTIVLDNAHCFKNNGYVANSNVDITATFTYSLTLAGRLIGNNPAKAHLYFMVGDLELGRITHDLADNATIITSAYHGLKTPFGMPSGYFGKKVFDNQKLTVDAQLVPGDRLRIVFEVNDRAAADLYCEIAPNATFNVETKRQQVLLGHQVQCERIFPDISLKDLLKDTLQRFGIICQTDSATRTVTFASFKNIVANIPIAKNWTGKCLDQGKAINFQLGGYAQVNYMKYKEDEAILPKSYGNAQINVKDKTLPATAELFESQFAATQARPYIAGTIAQIVKVDRSTDDTEIAFSISTQPRILINHTLNLLERSKQVIFTNGNATRVVNDAISTPYFALPDGNESLDWEQLRKTYYPELEKILQQTKKVVRYFMLSPRDILELDLLIPIYLEQDSAYYYINKIDSWRKSQPVKVELVKLG